MSDRVALSATVLALLAAGTIASWLFWVTSQSELIAQAQEDCTEVLSLGPETGNQTTEPFEITGNSFRVSGEVRSLRETAPLLQIFPKDETGQSVSLIPRYEEGPFDQDVLEGPGTFTLDITANAAEYTLTVEDCESTPRGEPGTIGTMENKAGPAPQPAPQPPLPSPPPTPPFKAGGSTGGPVPSMPNGKCPKEFPVPRGSACFR